MTFPAYPSYKDSEAEWLGRVPSHWSPTRLRFLTHLNPSKSEVSNLSPGTKVSFIPMEAISESGELSLGQTRPLSDVLTGYTYFRDGDVSIAKITPCFENGKGATMRGLSAGVGFGTTELIIARPRPDATTPEFLDWLFRSPAFRTRGEATMYGAGGQKRVPDDFVRDFISPGAPLAEQIAIAAFLDRETAKIDALVEEQQNLIALLKEKRKAIISHAVTKGLAPHAPMKNSGVEWIGEVPAHWEIGPLKRYWSVTDCKHLTAEFVDDGIPLASIREVQSKFVDLSVAKRTTEDFFEQLIEGGRKPESGDLIFSRNATVGELAQVADWHPPFAMGQDVCLLKRRQAEFCPDYTQLVLRSSVGETQLANLLIGSTFKRVNVEEIRNLVFPFPSPQEQREIATWLLRHADQYGDLSGEAERGIVLLKERRAALISAAVTGKIDVRGSAKVVPFPVSRARARGLIATEIIERSAHQATFGRVKFQKIAFLAEAHVGINEIEGSYTREAAGPLDRTLIDEMESGAHSIAGIEHEQPGGPGTTVSYRLGERPGAHRQELADWLGAERTAMLDKLIANCASLNTKQAEAVATLYGVWNDALREGASLTDDEIISGFLNDWHSEKRDKFRSSDLPEWLGWMRRHGVVPNGSGPKTTTGRFLV